MNKDTNVPRGIRIVRDPYAPRGIRIVRGPYVPNGVRIIKEASRKERKRAEKVRRQNERHKNRELKQLELFREGKATTKEVNYDDIPIWNKMLNEKHYKQLKEMGDTEESIAKFQKGRVMLSLVLLIVGGIAGVLIHSAAAGIGAVAAIVSYIMKGRGIDSFYKNWKFDRQLAFSKFTRLVIPYLKSSGGNMALYTVFNRVVRRMDDEEDKRNLYQLMGEMGEDPTNIQPFLDFADRSSGTDMSHLFMTTIFDFQQSTFDVTVIDELGKLASEDMMNSVDDIIEFKLQRFAMFPTKIVMSSFLLVAGLAVGMMIHSFQGLGFGTEDLQIDTEAPEVKLEQNETKDQSKIDSDGSAFIIDGNTYYV